MTFISQLPKCQACGGARPMWTPTGEFHVCRGPSKHTLFVTTLCDDCAVRAVEAVEKTVQDVRAEAEKGKVFP